MRRKAQPLLGMAVGPIQGQEHELDEVGNTLVSPSIHGPLRSSRRYRLLLTYLDHTILSYEISRSSVDDEILMP